ncbi:hypothetical protein BGZ61DRAFT_482363 [Ilyonectria robusta]|uniref:uncharacterized protein n=1 Tax=Ilyonectria robusta TaxID=1079257 RepID=UPI001E8D00D1|nr:uncharacterized protein BGZ61DRAFT_482363 [Ilyonectria robusta]KAH8673114.1 hypothetical protein BGZ61DRAFT_482363 [Ilyonectria robusta]
MSPKPSLPALQAQIKALTGCIIAAGRGSWCPQPYSVLVCMCMCPRPPRQAAASSRQLVNDTAVPRQGPREPVSNRIGQAEIWAYSMLLVVGKCRQPCRQDNWMLPGVSIANSQTPPAEPDPLGPIASQAHSKASSYFEVRAIHSFAEKLAVLTKVVHHGGESLGGVIGNRANQLGWHTRLTIQALYQELRPVSPSKATSRRTLIRSGYPKLRQRGSISPERAFQLDRLLGLKRAMNPGPVSPGLNTQPPQIEGRQPQG